MARLKFRFLPLDSADFDVCAGPPRPEAPPPAPPATPPEPARPDAAGSSAPTEG